MSLDSYSYLYGLARSALLGSLVSYWRGMLVVWESRLVVEVRRGETSTTRSFHPATARHLPGLRPARPVPEQNAVKSGSDYTATRSDPSAAISRFCLPDLIALDFFDVARYARH